MVCIMKKMCLLILILFFTQVCTSCETLNYKIKQSGSSMVIIPYYSAPIIAPEANQNIEQAPVKIPFYESKKLPKGKNKSKNV